MRRSPGACEKFHGAVIDHAGRSDTKKYLEMRRTWKRAEETGARNFGNSN